MTTERLGACPTCGLIQIVGDVPRRHRARCARCTHTIKHAARPRAASRCAALCIAALVLYPAAMSLPVLEVERLGHSTSSTIWSGVVSLLAEGELLVGLVVLISSIIAPLAKLAAMLALCSGQIFDDKRHDALTYRAVEWIGRWGMIDVLLVTILVAAVKLGSWVEVTPGPGVAAFAGVVILSLAASAAFDPHAVWETDHAR